MKPNGLIMNTMYCTVCHTVPFRSKVYHNHILYLCMTIITCCIENTRYPCWCNVTKLPYAICLYNFHLHALSIIPLRGLQSCTLLQFTHRTLIREMNQDKCKYSWSGIFNVNTNFLAKVHCKVYVSKQSVATTLIKKCRPRCWTKCTADSGLNGIQYSIVLKKCTRLPSHRVSLSATATADNSDDVPVCN